MRSCRGPRLRRRASSSCCPGYGVRGDDCYAASATIFGVSEKVQYVPLSAQQRFTALQSGEVDALSNDPTWTLTRDWAAAGLRTAR